MQAAAIARYVALPLQAAPLLVIIVFSALLLLALYAGLLGIPLALALLTGFFNYAFILLDTTADGASEPPVLSVEMMNPVSNRRAVVLLAIIALLAAASHAGTRWLGAGSQVAGAIAGAVVLPAMIAMQGATGRALQALNLHTGLRLIGRLRGDYAILVA
ncbi:MAG TPA: hypothetical protein VKB34_20140, partial [Povalibacter sp.]|nr:hypothetical protein [Povalibacter sp.]